MKRANGTGTISHRRDKKRRRPFFVYMDGGHDDEGRRIRVFVGSYPTYREAQDALDKYRLGVTPRPSSKNAIQDVWDAFTAEFEATKNRKYNKNYLSTWKNYIKPRIGNVPIQDLKAAQLQACISACKSAAVQRFILSIFRNVYRYAIVNDMCEKDYTSALHTQQLAKSTMHKPFTTSELRWLWAQNSDIYKLILIQVYTGTRKNELSRIRMEDVHLAEHYMVGGEKTAAGKNRVIPIADCILPLVRHFYEVSLFARHPYLVMPDLNRNIYARNGVADIGKIYLKHFRAHSSHDARHTFVSMCSNYDVPESVVKTIVGHAGNDVTQAVYTHKTIGQLVVMVNRLPYGTRMALSPEESGAATG